MWNLDQLPRRMRIVKQPDPRRCRVIAANAAPALKGEGSLDYACGYCARVLLASVSAELVRDVAVRCATCRQYNDVPPPPSAA